MDMQDVKDFVETKRGKMIAIFLAIVIVGSILNWIF